MQIQLYPKQFHTCLEGQAGVATIYAPEGFANKLHDAVNLGLNVSEADVGERIAVLVNIHCTWNEQELLNKFLLVPFLISGHSPQTPGATALYTTPPCGSYLGCQVWLLLIHWEGATFLQQRRLHFVIIFLIYQNSLRGHGLKRTVWYMPYLHSLLGREINTIKEIFSSYFSVPNFLIVQNPTTLKTYKTVHWDLKRNSWKPSMSDIPFQQIIPLKGEPVNGLWR